MNMRATRLLALCISTFFGALNGAQAENLIAVTPHMSVALTASEQARPDQAILYFNLTVERPSAAEASSLAKAAADQVVAAVKGAAPGAAIEEGPLLVSPVIGEPVENVFGGVKKTISAQRASIHLSARLSDPLAAGAAITRAVEAQPTSFRAVVYDVSNRQERLKALRARAVAEARREAVAQLGDGPTRLGRALKIDVSDGVARDSDDEPYAKKSSSSRSAAAALDPMQIVLSATARVTYELREAEAK